MSANSMNIEDVYQVLNDIHNQVIGQPAYATGVVSMDQYTFVSVANTLFQNGPDIVYNALMNTIAKTIFSTRPYSRQFGGLITDNVKYGAIVRKIQFGDTDAVPDSAFSGLPADGSSVDHYTINRGDVLETRYYGSAEYQDVMTVFRDQLVTAFQGPEQLGSFISAKATEINNKWVQWTEDLARGLILNAVAAKQWFYDADPIYTTRVHCLHLLTMYNTDTGASPALTLQDIMTEQYAKPFWEYVRAKIRTLQRDFTNRNMLHYENITDSNGVTHKIVRHTPYDRQKVYLSAFYMDLMETSTLTEAFNNDYLKYADYEGVAYWQNPYFPTSYRVAKATLLEPTTGSYLDYDSEDITLESDVLLGIIFDEDMMSINIKDTIIQNTPMNARGLYYNTWLTAHAQYLQDFTEKCTVLLLD